MKNIPFIKYSKLWLSIGVVLVIASILSLTIWGFKWGIDFSGGSLMELEFTNNRPETTSIIEVLEKNEINNPIVQGTNERGVIIRVTLVTEEAHLKLLNIIKTEFQTEENIVIEKRFDMIGPSVSSQLRQRSIWATIFVCLGIIGYVTYAFRVVSRPVASWKYGLTAIISVVFDILIVMGVFAALGKFKGVEIDIAFVVAILTILGYSINDSIVVFDRVRERLQRKTNKSFPDLVNSGLNQTLMRSINTTTTTLMPLLALYFFGGTTIHNFALALIIGIISGAYSSIFIGSPLLVLTEKWQRK